MAEDKEKKSETKKSEGAKAPAEKAPAQTKSASANKTKAESKPVAKKAEPKADKTDKASKSTKTEKKKPSGKSVTITQIGSPIGRQAYQRATLIGLGLNKMHKTRTLEDTPCVRGMIKKVSHLVKVEEAA